MVCSNSGAHLLYADFPLKDLVHVFLNILVEKKDYLFIYHQKVNDMYKNMCRQGMTMTEIKITN